MKLVIVIPSYNEETTLPVAFAELPRKIPGVDKIETLVINDGSTDRTADVARELKATKVVSFCSNQGLARAFQEGLRQAALMKADIIVVFDADNQYKAAHIPRLIQPICNHQADMVVGCRPIQQISHFSPLKKFLQKVGSRVVYACSKIQIPDATSGFRAYSREAALKLVIVSNFTYTLETLIQARNKGLTVTHVPIDINEGKLRESRLFKGNTQYVIRSMNTILRMYFMYRPFKILGRTGLIFISGASILSFRFLYYHLLTPPHVQAGHIQSLILAAILFILGGLLIVLSLIADLIHHNRKYIEEVLYYQRKNEIN